MSVQSCDRPADAGQTRRSRAMLPRGAPGAARLPRRAQQSAVLAQLPHRPDGGGDICRIRDWDRRHAAALAPQNRGCGSTGRSHAVCASVMFPPISANMQWRGSPNRCWRRMTGHRIELFCYAEVAAPDAVTARFRALADHWRSIVGPRRCSSRRHDPRETASTCWWISAGHTAGSRLLVFARKPAPVQVAYLLGHGYTSGLSAMDAFLADAVLAPPGADALFSERIMRLPRIPLAYAPPDAMPPVAPLPALANGFVTFGYFGRPERLNDAVIAAWARILQRCAGGAAGAEQPAIPGTGIPRTDRCTICRAGHRSRSARPDSDRAAARHLGGVWRDRHRARSIPAQCRHHHDRGIVAGSSGRLAGGAAERRTVRRDDPARRRDGRLGQRRMPTATLRAPLPLRPICLACADSSRAAAARRGHLRCAMQRAWRGTLRRPIRGPGDGAAC